MIWQSKPHWSHTVATLWHAESHAVTGACSVSSEGCGALDREMLVSNQSRFPQRGLPPNCRLSWFHLPAAAYEAGFTYPLALTNRLCKAGPALRCCWSYRCTLTPLLFPHLCEKHWHGGTFNPFKIKRLLWLFFFFHSYTAAPGIWKIIISLW